MKRSNRRTRRGKQTLPQEVRFHPSPFFGTEDLSNLFDSVSSDDLTRTQDWRAAIEGKKEHETYLYPVEEENGRFYLKLNPLSEGRPQRTSACPRCVASQECWCPRSRELQEEEYSRWYPHENE